MCQGTTKAGKPCRSKSEPWCNLHRPADVYKPVRQALEALVSGSDAPPVLVELARVLADDMDRGQFAACVECSTPYPTGRSASLVKQYREVLEVLLADDSDDADPIGDLLAQLRDTPAPGATEPAG